MPYQVARHLLALIKREQGRPGDQVPSEVQIGKDLQVSRGSVREAYRTPVAPRATTTRPCSGDPDDASNFTCSTS